MNRHERMKAVCLARRAETAGACEEDCALLTDNFASTDSPTGICAITLIGTMLCDLAIEYPPDRWYQHNDIDL